MYFLITSRISVIENNIQINCFKETVCCLTLVLLMNSLATIDKSNSSSLWKCRLNVIRTWLTLKTFSVSGVQKTTVLGIQEDTGVIIINNYIIVISLLNSGRRSQSCLLFVRRLLAPRVSLIGIFLDLAISVNLFLYEV